MKIVVDENVSYEVAQYLKDIGHDVIAIAVAEHSGLPDSDIFELAKKEKAILLTRDHHFTNSLRFPPDEVSCIIFIRKGNLRSREELDLIKWFFQSFDISDFEGRLVTISRGSVKVR